ncbi:hypothetical protein FCK90_13895 [Kocuria coralli]|uniref:Transposase n=1 Tax=Kocuria coralli TaxID=1461025 RepID=A0A5J5KW85_9MICC|nr:hypothetical protein [Kocuria coralli]KAA9393111.1 hypothetical protein FCK90_13895 [Kocuria coralli]
MDPKPGWLYKTLTKIQLAERLAARDKEKSKVHRARVHEFGNALLGEPWMLLPREVRREFKGDIAVDATVIASPGRGRGHASLFASSDPEAGWYKRDGDHNGEATSRAATKYQRRSSIVSWARELHTAVTYGDNVPVMILSATLAVPGHELEKNALGCVDAVLARGIPPGHFVSDRPYLPGKKPENLALPIRKRGYSLVFNYNRTQTSLGQSPSHKRRDHG